MELSKSSAVNGTDSEAAADVAVTASTLDTVNTMNALETARMLLKDYGFHSINYRRRAKGPTEAEWQKVRAEGDELTERFRKPTNIGILLGEASGSVMDVDLDRPEAIELADDFLPTTGLTWGRPEQDARSTHRLYIVESEDGVEAEYEKFELPSVKAEDGDANADKAKTAKKRTTIVELRYTGQQSMCPPSQHPDEDFVRWMAVGEPARVTYSALLKAAGQIAAATVIAKNWPASGSRHGYALALAGVFARRGLPEDEAARLIAAAGRVAGDGDESDRMGCVHGTYDRWVGGSDDASDKSSGNQHIAGIPTLKQYFDDERELTLMLKWLGLATEQVSRNQHPDEVAEGADGFPLTDVGNGERLVARFGDRIHWVPAWGKWIVWDGVVWREDDMGLIQQLRKETIRALMKLAATLDADSSQRALMYAWAVMSESGQHPEKMLEHARYEPGISIDARELDRDPMLLNCPNGVVDLTSGELLPHDPSYLMTRLTDAAYRPETRSATWNEFLATVQPDAEVREYVQRAMGYSLTGSVEEKAYFMNTGETNTGKSTIAEAVGRTLGTYAKSASFESFARHDRGNAIRNDIARLDGARYVWVSETDEGRQLAVGLIKALTGGDTQTARYLHKEHFQFVPQMKLWFCVNDRPQVPSSDEAIWERVREVPFNVRLKSPDMTFEQLEAGKQKQKELLDPQQSGEAILAWVVAGCLAWRREGLWEPGAIKQAREGYREESRDNDPAQQFIEECLIAGEFDDVIPTSKVKRAYERWIYEMKVRGAPGSRRFRQVLQEHGFREDRAMVDGQQVRVWRGIKAIRIETHSSGVTLIPSAQSKRPTVDGVEVKQLSLPTIRPLHAVATFEAAENMTVDEEVDILREIREIQERRQQDSAAQRRGINHS